jgi:hypothetical protein
VWYGAGSHSDALSFRLGRSILATAVALIVQRLRKHERRFRRVSGFPGALSFDARGDVLTVTWSVARGQDDPRVSLMSIQVRAD